VRRIKISKYRFWRDYTPSLHGTVKMQSEQFHFSCEAYRAIYFEFPFHEASCHLRPEERGTETPLQNRNAWFFLVLKCTPPFGAGSFSLSAIQFDELPKKGRRATDRTRLSYDRFSKDGAAASTLHSRLRQPNAPIVLPKGFSTYRRWAKKFLALNVKAVFRQCAGRSVRHCACSISESR
jgi:hypothetical protein